MVSTRSTFTGGSANATFTVDNAQFGKVGAAALDYSNVANLILNGGVGGDTYYVGLAGLAAGVQISDYGTSAGNQVIFSTGPGNNLVGINGYAVSMGSTAVAYSGMANVVVVGGDGDNTFLVDYSAATSPTYSITGGSGPTPWWTI